MWLNVCVRRPSSSCELAGTKMSRRPEPTARAARIRRRIGATRPRVSSSDAMIANTTSNPTTTTAPTICSRNCRRCCSNVSPSRTKPIGVALDVPVPTGFTAPPSPLPSTPEKVARGDAPRDDRRDDLDIALAVDLVF